jgi:hypothetical protein
LEEGSPQEWIDMQKDLEETWTHNSSTGGTNIAFMVRALVLEESAFALEIALQDARTVEGLRQHQSVLNMFTRLLRQLFTEFVKQESAP